MALNDVYSVTLRQTLLGQRITNVFFYEQFAAYTPTSGTHAANLALNWQSALLSAINNVQSTDVVNVAIDVENLFVGTDVSSLPITWGGGFGTNVDSAFQAAGFKLAVAGKTTRAGAKRIGGVPDNISTDGVITDATYLTSLAGTETAMQAIISATLPTTSNVWRPCVVGRIREVIAGKVKYRLPNALVEKVIQVVADVVLTLILTTQNSRKIGRGD
jgi:hypothetical protein